jgi:predicted O-methyltransferase YrrM
MDSARRVLAEELLERSREHDAAQGDRLDRFRNVEPDTAELLAVLVRTSRARTILELGTSNGYSTIWLADAAEDTGGRVRSVDVDPSRTALAAESLARAELEVDLLSVDAAEVLRDSSDGCWDLIFLDAERPAYAGYWPELLRVLRPDGGLLAVDNVLSHPHEVVELTALIDGEPTVSSTVVPCGAGLRLVVRGSVHKGAVAAGTGTD